MWLVCAAQAWYPEPVRAGQPSALPGPRRQGTPGARAAAEGQGEAGGGCGGGAGRDEAAVQEGAGGGAGAAPRQRRGAHSIRRRFCVLVLVAVLST